MANFFIRRPIVRLDRDRYRHRFGAHHCAFPIAHCDIARRKSVASELPRCPTHRTLEQSVWLTLSTGKLPASTIWNYIIP